MRALSKSSRGGVSFFYRLDLPCLIPNPPKRAAPARSAPSQYKDIITKDGERAMTPLLGLFGGMSAGCFSTLGNNPFDVVKVRIEREVIFSFSTYSLLFFFIYFLWFSFREKGNRCGTMKKGANSLQRTNKQTTLMGFFIRVRRGVKTCRMCSSPVECPPVESFPVDE